MDKIDGNIYWVDSNGDMIRFDAMNEKYILTLMEYFAKRKSPIPVGLVSRAKYFQEKRKEIKDLF